MLTTQKDLSQTVPSPPASQRFLAEPLEDFLTILRHRGIVLWAEGDRLHYRATKQTLTPDILGQLKHRKAEILAFLRQAACSQPSSLQPIVPIERTERLPLSFNQQRLWLVEQFDPGKPVYNLPLAYQFQGLLDVDVLHCCLKEIVQRHEVLRSTFHVDNGEPYQVIAEKVDVPLAIIDFQDIPEHDREAEAKRVATEQAKQPFDLEQGPLFRFELLRLSSTEHILVYNTHHIISDGWSSEVFFKELTALYAAFSNHLPSPIPDLPVQYVDYAAWQRQWFQGEVLHQQLDYWKQTLSGELPVLQLPTDQPRPAMPTYRGRIARKMLPASLVEALQTISQEGNATLSMILMAAFKVLLYRYSGQEDIIVGSPVAGRNRLEVENLIGFFVNTLAFRTDLSGNPTFREVLERVRQVSLGAYSNQDVPFDLLLQVLQPERDPSRSPVFQVMFAMNAPWTEGNSRQLSGLTISSTFGYVHNSSSSFDLTLVTRDTGKGLRVSIEYSLDLFEPDTIERMLQHFQTLLEGIVANPELPISELPLLTQAERYQLLIAWNQTQTDYPSTLCLHQLIEAQVEKTPDAIALIADQHSLSYRELNARANQLAYVLRQNGVCPDMPVVLYVERSLEFTIGVLGTLKAGGAYVPITPIMPAERRLEILQDVQPAVILTQSHLITSLPADYLTRSISLDDDWKVIAAPTTNLPCLTSPDHLAYIIYTSGSTGKPKGVAIPHRGVVNHALAIAKQFELTEHDHVLQFSSLSFDICVEELFPTWLMGATLVLRTEAIAFSTTEFLQFIDHYQITLVDLPTAFWHELVNGLSTLSLSLPKCLRLVVVGGEKASYSAYQTWIGLVGHYPRWLNTYGPTETTVTATVYDPSTASQPLEIRRELPIGRPLANVQTYILDSHLQPVPVGVPGELFIGGAGLARGYLNRPELTCEKFIDVCFQLDHTRTQFIKPRLYRTGDRARYLPDGTIEYLDRLDTQVKIRGFRIELSEIESTLALHPAVMQSVVVVRAGKSGQQQLVAYVVTCPQARFEANTLRNFLKQKLPLYMVPSSFVPIDAVPLTTHGKVDYRALPDPDFGLPEPTKATVARDNLERELTAIWQATLGIPSICPHDNFFEIGGHSLLAVRLFASIEQKLGRNLPLATLLQAPTIAQLADLLRQQSKTIDWSPLVAIQPTGTKPPLFCIHGGGFNILIYRDLALNLGADQPVYGLQAQGLHGRGGIGSNRLEDIAADYINEIRRVQPRGPYFLAGLSNGGNIALEMAQQLQAQGEKVQLLVLFDTYAPDSIHLLPPVPRFTSSVCYVLRYSLPRFVSKFVPTGKRTLLTNPSSWRKQAAMDTASEPLSTTRRPLQGYSMLFSKCSLTAWMNGFSQYVLEHSPWSFLNPSAQLGVSEDTISRTLKNLEETYKKIHKAYRPSPYEGKAILFCAKETPPGYYIAPYLGWSQIIKEIEMYQIPGHHTSIMKSPILAEKLKIHLNENLIDSVHFGSNCEKS